MVASMRRHRSFPLNFAQDQRRQQAAKRLKATAIGAVAGLAAGLLSLQALPSAHPAVAAVPSHGSIADAPDGAALDRRFGFCPTGGGRRGDCVVDGDTFWIDGAKIRIADIDAPETHPPRCADEAAKGDAATRRLQALLNAGPFDLVVEGRDRDRYGRALRVVVRDGRSLGGQLVAEGLARPWTGHREPWC